MSAGFALLQRFLRESSGLSLEDDKRYLAEDRLRPVLRARGITTLDELAQRLHLDRKSDLADAVAESLTINETSFFRDRAFFAALSDTLLPRLLAARATTRRLRIWCAGCSTGQEPYSLAMVLDDMGRRLADWHVEILATDLSRSVIETARAGSYSQFEVQRGLPVTMLLRHFTRSGERWLINDRLRQAVSFQTGNLLAIPRDAGPFDLVLCRNVLYYFDAATRRQVLQRLLGCLASDGLVAMGGAERGGGDLLADSGLPYLFRRAAPVLLHA